MPPPPTTDPDFQPSGPLPPGLKQMELNLHHHIESCFGSLMRLTTNNTDRAIDKVVRRVDDLQELVEKGFKNLRSELKEMRKEVSTIRRDNLNASKASESLQDSIDLLGTKLDQVDQKINNMESHDQHGAVEASENERVVSSVYSQGQNSPLRRLEPLRTSAMSRQEQRQPYASGTTHASANTHGAISIGGRGRRSTISSGSAARRNDEGSMPRREMVITQLGQVTGPVPDIREHPAYRGVIEGYVQSSPIYHTPNYSEIWYQQAYGDRR